MTQTTNIDRLLAYLDADSLAAALVRAYGEANPEEQEAALQNIIDDRLAALRAELTNASD